MNQIKPLQLVKNQENPTGSHIQKRGISHNASGIINFRSHEREN